MFKILKKIFGNTSIKSKNFITKNISVDSYFIKELNACSYIKSDAHAIVIRHLLQEINLNKTGNKLSVQEKKDLGINARLSITHELVEVLTNSGLSQPDPKKVFSSIYCKAIFAKNHDDTLNKYRKIDINHYKIMACNDERDCEWCNSMNGKKLSINNDINKLIEKNCKCNSHCRLAITAVID